MTLDRCERIVLGKRPVLLLAMAQGGAEKRHVIAGVASYDP